MTSRHSSARALAASILALTSACASVGPDGSPRPPACGAPLERPLEPEPGSLAEITHEPAGDLEGTARFVAAVARGGVLSLSLRAGEVDHRIDVARGSAPPIEPGAEVQVALDVADEEGFVPHLATLVLRDESGRVLAWYGRGRGGAAVDPAVAVGSLGDALGVELAAVPACITSGGRCGRHAVRYAIDAGEARTPGGRVTDGSIEWAILAHSLADDHDRWPDGDICAISGVSDVSLDAIAVLDAPAL